MKKTYSTRGVAISLLKVVLYFALYLAIQIAVINIIYGILVLKFPSFDSYQLTEVMEALSLEINIIGCILTVAALALIAKLNKSSLSHAAEIKKYPGGFTLTLLIMGVASAYAIMLIFGLLEEAGIFPESWIKAQSSSYRDVYSAGPFMRFISVCVVAPIMEEVLFRGFILGSLKKEMHPWIAVAVSAVVFAIAHGTPIGIMYTLLLGLLMGWLTVTFKSIVPSVLLHMAYNGTVAYSGGVSLGIAVLSLPILAFEIYSIKNYFRGKKE